MNLTIIQGYLSGLLLALFAGGIVAEFYNSHRLKRPVRVITAIWLTHGLVFYSAVMTARALGVRVGDPVYGQLFTIWSTVLRIHFVTSIILYNNIVDYLIIRERRASE